MAAVAHQYRKFLGAGAIFVLWTQACFGQIDISRYTEGNLPPVIDLGDYLEPELKWTMKGNIQVDMNEGLNDLREGNIQPALANFNAVIARDSTFAPAIYYRGVCRKKSGRLDLAGTDFERSLRLAPTAEAYVELGELSVFGQRFDLARQQFMAAVKLNPILVQARYGFGCLMMLLHQEPEATKYFEECNRVDARFPAAYAMFGRMLFARREISESIVQFGKALEADPTYHPAYFWRGIAYLSEGATDKGLHDFNQAVARNPTNTFYGIMRGFVFVELKKYDEAFSDFRKAITSREVNEDQFNVERTTLDKQIDLQEALKYLVKTGYGLTDSSFTEIKKGFCLLVANQLVDAFESFRIAKNIQHSALSYYLMAVAIEHGNNHGEASELYSKALALDNDIFDAHKKRSIYRCENKDFKSAYDDIDQMVRLQPESSTAYRLKKFISAKENEQAKAKTDSVDWVTIRNKVDNLEIRGDKKGAAEESLRLLTIRPGNRELFADIASHFLKLGDTAQAIIVYEKFPRKEFHFELAQLYIATNQRALALTEITRIRELIEISAAIFKNASLNNHALAAQNYEAESDLTTLEAGLDFNDALWQMALTKLDKAIKLKSDNLPAIYLRAKCYSRLGKKSKARVEFKRLAKVHFRDSEKLAYQ